MKFNGRKILKYIMGYILGFIVIAVITHVGVRYVLKLPAPLPVVPEYPPDDGFRVFSDYKSMYIDRRENYFSENYPEFSMVCPKNWDTSLASNTISSWSQPNRLSSATTTGYLVATPIMYEIEEIKSFPKTKFQEKDAHFLYQESPPRKMFGPSGYSYTIFFERDNSWFQIMYSTNKKQKEMPPPMIWEYFNTFRIENASTADDQD